MKKKGLYKQKLHNCHSALWLCLLLILILTLAGTNLAYFTNTQLPMPFGYGIANVLTGSMEPTFSSGTLLLIKATEDVQPGDIIVYESDSSLVVHRVISIDGNTITTQGDANNVPDQPFDKSHIKGRVIGRIPFMGSALKVLQSPAVIIFLIICIVLLMKSSSGRKKEENEDDLESIKQEIQQLKQEIEESKKNDMCK